SSVMYVSSIESSTFLSACDFSLQSGCINPGKSTIERRARIARAGESQANSVGKITRSVGFQSDVSLGETYRRGEHRYGITILAKYREANFIGVCGAFPSEDHRCLEPC